MHARAAARNRRHGGFTLLEVLTAMVVFFMVAGILATAVAQAMRVVEVGANETTAARDQAMRLEWFRETVALTILPPIDLRRVNPEPPLTGDGRMVSGMSLRPPASQSLAPEKYKFELKFDAATGETQLLLSELAQVSGGFSGQTGFVLLSWLGSEGGFRYLDDEDRWQDVWPQRAGLARVGERMRLPLPKAVELRYGAAGNPVKAVVVAIQDRALPPPSTREMTQ